MLGGAPSGAPPMAALDPAIATMLFEPGYDCRAISAFARRAWRFADATLDLLYPPHCSSCGAVLPAQINKALCRACTDQIRWMGEDRCVRCGDAVGPGIGAASDCVSCRANPPRFVNAAVCALKYEEGPARDLVLALKFGGKSHLAKTLGRILARRIAHTSLLDASGGAVIVPAPLMRAALFKRGYNQAEELAVAVADELKLKLETRLLKKIRATRPQAMLSEKQRRENLVGAFACDAKRARKYKAATILLIDDVITTGSTISECARTLHGAGAKKIFAASFARG